MIVEGYTALPYHFLFPNAPKEKFLIHISLYEKTISQLCVPCCYGNRCLRTGCNREDSR